MTWAFIQKRYRFLRQRQAQSVAKGEEESLPDEGFVRNTGQGLDGDWG